MGWFTKEKTVEVGIKANPAKVEVITQPAKFDPVRAKERMKRIKATLDKGRVQKTNQQKAMRLEAEYDYLRNRLHGIKKALADLE